MDTPTVWYGIKITTKDSLSRFPEVCEHLSMNGYTFDTNGENVLFIYEEEFEYVLTILDDREMEYTIL